MIKLFGTTRRKRIISFFLLITFVSEIVTPTATFALTGGPSQPEVQAFTPVSTAEMVDLTSGDFKYNIPLMDVGGYPLNIAYNSGIGMDDEASWTGLGWNLNVGSINRNMRGLPDDFNGELIEKEFNMKDNTTYGVTVGVGVELFGYQKQGSSSKTSGKLNIGLGISYNNYTGIGMEQSMSTGISAGNPGKGSMNAGLGMKSSNSGGLTISPNLSFSARMDDAEKKDATADNLSVGIGMGVNSRSGLKDLSINAGYKREGEKTIKAQATDGSTVDVDISTGGGTGSAGIINFGASTFVPRIQNNMVNNSVALSFKLGTTIFGLDGDVTLGGYFSNQSLMDPYTSTAAYGYMFSHAGQDANNVLMDFNREKDQAFSRYTKNLPVTNQTYDVFSVTGQGIGGAFRPFRSEVGYVFDNRATNTSDSYSAGGEIGAGQTFHGGIDISVVDVNTVSGKWENDNDAKGIFSAHSTTNDKDYEPYYFREVGEKSSDEIQNALYQQIGQDEAYRIQLDRKVNHLATKNLERYQNGPALVMTGPNYIQGRQRRNQVMSSLSLAEAKNYGFDTSLYSGVTSQINAEAKDHHIAEITALRVDGSRYIYGLPAYNTVQEEITFNASASSTTGNNLITPANTSYTNALGYVSYGANDISVSNAKGIDNYYNRVKMPAYAHSYLLTAIVSPDYVDVQGDGPDDNDLGNYTKFEYEKVSDMKWRIPFDANKANFNENGKSVENDDQGNFVYGNKDLWFVKKIITRNYVAVFKTGDRHDARGANDVNGGLGSNSAKTKYLESVSLYARPEYDANGSNAVPIKVVHFVYDYSLCPGVPNNDGISEMVNSVNINQDKGKLTLKEVYFTYGKSDKAKVNKYKFAYGQAHANSSSLTNNFRYHPKAYDRWGNYMPLNNSNANYIAGAGTPTITPAIDYAYNSSLNNAEFPYVDQFSKADADFRASGWNLTQIDLPSGAAIKINYESDDYAFVQNRPAMQMMNVIDVNTSTNLASLPALNSVGDLYTQTSPPPAAAYANHVYIHFELTGNLSSSGAGVSDEIRQKYLKDINTDGKYLYFRFLANVTRSGPAAGTNKGDHFEYVSGYAEMDGATPDCGLTATSGGGILTGPHGFPVAYVKLKEVVRDDKTSQGALLKISPIAKAVLNFGKTHYNNLVWDASFSPPGDVVGALRQLASEATGGPFKTIMQAVKGPNNSLMDKQYGKEFVRNKSFIRLYNPDGRKFGGGSRVKSLSIDDNWNLQTANPGNLNGQDKSVYGQEFTYETEFWGETVSSGVASYEPMLGGDENPFRQPVFMGPNKFTMLVPDERFFMEEPFGESFFPSASISYSKVKVKNKIPSGTNVKTHGTGYVVHEFYTAKDYPTITDHTPINPKQYKPPLGGLLKVMSRDYVSASQGYVIKLNDMHGKPKAQSVYAEGSATPMSKVEYFYKTKGGNYTEYGLVDIHSDARCIPNELDNTCTVINKDGEISERTIGLDFDAVTDFRETQTTTVMGGAQINLSLFLVGFFPGAVPAIWPSFSFEKTRFRSAVMTKVISKYGILDRTVAHDNGSSVTTANLAFDAQTGDVLVTRTKNDFHDDIYSVKYPAYWGYDLMGPAYKNIGYSENVTFSAGVAPVASPGFYNIGDEIALGGGNVGWICHIDYVLKEISVIDRSGVQSMNGNMNIKVLRSGRRNLLGAQMASLTSLVNPVDYDNNPTNGLNPILDVRTNGSTDYKVLNTSAIEYSDQWQTFKGYSTLVPAHCESYMNAKGTAVFNYITSLFGPGHPPSTAMANNHTNTHVISVSGCQYDLILSNPGATWNQIPTHQAEISIFPPGDCSNNQLEVTGAYSQYDIPNWYLNNGFTTPLPGVTRFGFIAKPVSGSSSSCNLLNFDNVPAQTTTCGLVEGDLVNPFLYGIKGSWRPKTTWSYLAGRYQKNASGTANTDVRNDGYIPGYLPFYRIPASTGADWTKNATNWTYTSEVTKVNPNGVEVENKDALGRYSSAQYGTCGMSLLPLAVASNARLQEMGYDGFEDYTCAGEYCFNNAETHFDFMRYRPFRTNQESHTGKYSMKIEANALQDIIMSKSLTTSACTSPVSAACSYSLTCSDFIVPFSPITYDINPKKYVLSYWVKEKAENIRMGTQILDYENAMINVSLTGSGSIIPGTLKKSEIIDGWQRLEYTFTISAGASGYINFALKNLKSSGWLSTCYFDDIRVHPFNSNMKSFVYDPVTLKYVAELDANNFATFYEYDEEGSLVRVKKETEKGIMTIQETKNHTKL